MLSGALKGSPGIQGPPGPQGSPGLAVSTTTMIIYYRHAMIMKILVTALSLFENRL